VYVSVVYIYKKYYHYLDSSLFVILRLGDYTYHCIRYAVCLMNLVFFSSVNFKHLGHNTCCHMVMRMPVSTVPCISLTF
jgi:hypothetical protein